MCPFCFQIITKANQCIRHDCSSPKDPAKEVYSLRRIEQLLRIVTTYLNQAQDRWRNRNQRVKQKAPIRNGHSATLVNHHGEIVPPTTFNQATVSELAVNESNPPPGLQVTRKRRPTASSTHVPKRVKAKAPMTVLQSQNHNYRRTNELASSSSREGSELTPIRNFELTSKDDIGWALAEPTMCRSDNSGWAFANTDAVSAEDSGWAFTNSASNIAANFPSSTHTGFARPESTSVPTNYDRSAFAGIETTSLQCHDPAAFDSSTIPLMATRDMMYNFEGLLDT